VLPCCRCASTRTSTPLTAYLACVALPCQSARQSCCPRLCFCFYSESSHRASSSSHLLPTYLSCIPYTRTHTYNEPTTPRLHPRTRLNALFPPSALSPVADKVPPSHSTAHTLHRPSARVNTAQSALQTTTSLDTLDSRLPAPSTFDPFAFHSWTSCWPNTHHNHRQRLIPPSHPLHIRPATT
jgi:hypothetical protein